MSIEDGRGAVTSLGEVAATRRATAFAAFRIFAPAMRRRSLVKNDHYGYKVMLWFAGRLGMEIVRAAPICWKDCPA